MRKLEGLVGIAIDGSELEEASADYERQVDVAVRADPDVQAFVERLEATANEESEDEAPFSMPSGEQLANDLQNFLRQRGGDGPDGPPLAGGSD